MSITDIIRAWKDEEYRSSLSLEEQAQLPANPAGQIELNAATLSQVVGGKTYSELSCHCTNAYGTAGCCQSINFQCNTFYCATCNNCYSSL